MRENNTDDYILEVGDIKVHESEMKCFYSKISR
jgi:hypothetical protein